MPEVRTPVRDRADRFGVGTRIDGYEVIDLSTGRPVSARVYEQPQQANGAAYNLNGALIAGPKTLARALGALDGPSPHEYIGGRNYQPLPVR